MSRNLQAFFFLVSALSLTFLSCKDDDPVLFPNDIVSPYYFQIVVSGDTTTYQEDISNYGNIVGDFWGGPVSSGYQYAPFTCIASAEAIANTTPENLTNSGAAAILANSSFQRNTLSEYIGIPTSGEKGIGVLARTSLDSTTAGGFISWFDDQGVEWNTNNGPQTGTASFVVTEVSDLVDDTRAVTTYKIVAMEFRCTLYDEEGNSRQVWGRTRGRMIAWR